MIIDVPSAEVCRRLAEFWPNPEESTRHLSWVNCLEEGRDVVNASAWGHEIVPARTTGEMLAFIAAKGWDARVVLLDGMYSASVHTALASRPSIRHGESISPDNPADALGRALVAALAKEKGKP